MEIFLGWVVLSIVAGAIASGKGRNGIGVFFLSLLLSPLVGLIVAGFMQRAETIDQAQAARSGAAGDYRKCPFCAEAIRREAVKCKHCGSEVAPLLSLTPQSPAPAPSQTPEQRAAIKAAHRTAGLIIFGGLAILIGILILTQHLRQ